MKSNKFMVLVILLLMLAPSGFCISGDNPSKRPTEDIPKKDAVLKAVPAYLDYTPFDWEDFRAMTRKEIANGLHKAIQVGLDKAQAGSSRIDIVRLTSPADIQAFRVLLTHRQNMTPAKAFGDTRLLFDADNGETQVFVDQGGVVSQGSQLWQLSPQDFVQLKQILNQIYAAIPPPANWGIDAESKTKTKTKK